VPLFAASREVQLDGTANRAAEVRCEEVRGACARAARLPRSYLTTAGAVADVLHMRSTRLAILVVVVGVTGCHLRAGVDTAARAKGPLHTLMSQSTVSRQDGVINLPPANGRNYALEAGFGNRTFTVNSLLAVHDVTSTSFTPGAGYLATTVGADVRWTFLHWKGLSPAVAAGPARMLLVDRTTGDRTWGNVVRIAAGGQYKLGPIAIYGDLYREVVAFGDGAARGTTMLDGITLGVALQPY
jgi:hypothetical protein